jgi:uncharacterized protein
MPKQILITGASGLIGKQLTELLLQKGYRVSHLSRSAKAGEVPSFVWDIKKGYIDPNALTGIDAIIHLAGAGVGEKRWSEKWKKEILESRTLSTRLLFNELNRHKQHQVKAFLSASGISYYGLHLTNELFTEEAKPANDFLAKVAIDWEAEVDRINSLGIRVLKLRTGVVLSREGGALEQMAKPVRFYVGSPLASGKQYVSWIHMDDLCEIYIKALEDDSMSDVFNVVSPVAVANREMTAAIAQALNKPLWAPRVPAFILRMMVGEMADLVIYGCNVSSKKIEQAGYQFKFPEIKSALRDLMN